jgi:hypothetical protein
MHSSEYSGSCSEKGIKRANGICVRPDANILHAQGVDELNMRMGHAQQVEGFVHNMQHAQVDNFQSEEESPDRLICINNTN